MRFLNRTAAAGTPRIWGGHLHPFIITSCTWKHGKRARSCRSLLITAMNAKREHPSLRRSTWGGTQPSSHPLSPPQTTPSIATEPDQDRSSHFHNLTRPRLRDETQRQACPRPPPVGFWKSCMFDPRIPPISYFSVLAARQAPHWPVRVNPIEPCSAAGNISTLAQEPRVESAWTQMA
jgi:hypothetical protein